jgi:glucokinase
VGSESQIYCGRLLLAGDIGGTKTLLGLFEGGAARPAPIATDEFVTLDHASLEAIIECFLERRGIAARQLASASFGVAGAITDQVGQLTNVPWRVSAVALRTALGVERVHLLNDLEALAYAVPVLHEDEVATLQQGVRVASGNIAVIAAGTGLGESMLLNVDGRFFPGESEGGHADFAARTPRELEMTAALTRVYGRVSNEHILSGPGVVNVYRFTHDAFEATGDSTSATLPSKLCAGVAGVGRRLDVSDLPAAISRSAHERRCPKCVETVEMFVSAYGAEAGNVALRTVATFGVYVGGGIAPRILPSLRTGLFMDAFRAKAPQDHLVARIPVAVILNPRSGLLGAAVHANSVVPSA